MSDIPILTTPIVEGIRIIEYKGLVTSRSVRAVNIFRDFFTAFRDIFGGRSASYQEVMGDMQREVLAEIRTETQRMGGNAVIGFVLDFESIGSKGKSLIMAFAKGTAVVFEQQGS